jgi:SAM-dependent methyltransferase
MWLLYSTHDPPDPISVFLMTKKADTERYDKKYFDRWYRDSATKVKSPASIRRKAALALGVAEYYMERRVRSVLDVGCGEGNWLSHLRSLRPGIHYTGVDSSTYAVGRYGNSRGIRLGSIGSLDECGLESGYDLVICSDTLFYLSNEEMDKGLSFLSPRTLGVAFLELYTDSDSVIGDFPNSGLRSCSFYRKLLARHGFRSVGSHCYLGPAIAHHAMEMEG